MSVSAELAYGLQEWAVTCRALGEGAITLVVRKGGIHERGGGLFQLEHQRFVLMPTYLHQDQSRLLPSYRNDYFAAVSDDRHPGYIHCQYWAEAVCIWKVTDLVTVQKLGPALLWNENDLAIRFAYRDQPWLYVVALRVYVFQQTQVLRDEPRFAGCRSWIALSKPLSTDNATPVLADAVHAQRLAVISEHLGAMPH